MPSTYTRPVPSILTALVGLLAPPAFAQEQPPTSSGEQNPVAEQPEFVTVEEFDAAMAEVDALREKLGAASPGTTGFLLSGYMALGYRDAAEEASTFYGTFNPLFLWRLDKNFLFESQLEIVTDAEPGGNAVEMEYAQVSWTANDWATIGVGKFLSPVGLFNERFHPAWINPLPTAPLFADHGGLVPASLIGAQMRGNVAAGTARLKYAVFIANGPQLNTGAIDPMEAGLLHWEAGAAEIQNKAMGGRVGLQPVPWLEFGVSGLTSTVDATGTSTPDADANLYAADLMSVVNLKDLGTLRLLGEWTRSAVDNLTYLPGTPDAATYDNTRNGAYGQLAWRPAGTGILSRLEGVIRYDWLDQPQGAPMSDDVRRWTAGFDYWLSERTIIKIAVDQVDTGGLTSNNFFLQAVIGL